MIIKIYYEDQTDWGNDNFYKLYRYLNKMILNHKDQNIKEIDELDTSLMSTETLVILKSIILTQNKEFYFEKDNLSILKDINPLDIKLNLVDNPRDIYKIFSKYNIGL